MIGVKVFQSIFVTPTAINWKLTSRNKIKEDLSAYLKTAFYPFTYHFRLKFIESQLKKSYYDFYSNSLHFFLSRI